MLLTHDVPLCDERKTPAGLVMGSHRRVGLQAHATNGYVAEGKLNWRIAFRCLDGKALIIVDVRSKSYGETDGIEGPRRHGAMAKTYFVGTEAQRRQMYTPDGKKTRFRLEIGQDGLSSSNLPLLPWREYGCPSPAGIVLLADTMRWQDTMSLVWV